MIAPREMMSAKRILICVDGRVMRCILKGYIKKFVYRVVPVGDVVISSWIALDYLVIVFARAYLIGIVGLEGFYGVTLDVDGCVVDLHTR